MKTGKLVTSRDIAKLMIGFTFLAALALSASVFIVRVTDGTPFAAALYTALTVAGLIVVTMVIFSALIVRDFRKHYKTPTSKPLAASHEQHLPKVS